METDDEVFLFGYAESFAALFSEDKQWTDCMGERNRVRCKGNGGAGGGYKSSCDTEGEGLVSLQG